MRFIRVALASAIVWVIAMMHIDAAGAEERWTDVFFDRDDGSLDASEWLLDRKGFLPVPIIITEPAVGYGGGAALLFFRQSIREATSETGHVTPPDIFGAAVVGTENGTKGAAVGGMFTFNDDRWRYRGGVGRPHINLDFYGLGGPLDTGDRKIGYTLDGWVSSQQLLWRLGKSNHFLALRWIYLDLDSTFEPSQQRPLLTEKETARRSSGLGPSWEYDSRDNIFTPSRGVKVAVDSLFYGLGSAATTVFKPTGHIRLHTRRSETRSRSAGVSTDARRAVTCPSIKCRTSTCAGFPPCGFRTKTWALPKPSYGGTPRRDGR